MTKSEFDACVTQDIRQMMARIYAERDQVVAKWEGPNLVFTNKNEGTVFVHRADPSEVDYE